MSIANLHSLFNRPWYIEETYAQGNMPLIMGVLGSDKLSDGDDEKKKPSLITHLSGTGGTGANKTVAVLDIKNPIVKHDQFCGPQGTKSMMRELEAIKTNDAVSGVVLDIDSGGGQAYGTPEFYDYLVAYPKPVVAYTDGLMCSAAYYIGCAADEIVVNKRAEAIGSIGAYSQLFDLKGYYEKQGVKVHTMYASKSTEKNLSYREAMKGEDFYDAYIKTELDPLVENFIGDMKAARPNINDAAFKGATYDGPKSVEMGLADSLGSLDSAIQRVYDLSATTNSKKINTMSKSYPKIEAVLGAKFDGEADENGLFLTDAQVDALEQNISILEMAGIDAVTAQTTAETVVANAATANAAIVAAANTALELSGDEAVTDVAGAIAGYQAKITALGKVPGNTHTEVGAEADEVNPHAGMDFNTPFYNKTKELLK